jgi:HPt (histidine-containing phosphotransfer) domain-containing protein
LDVHHDVQTNLVEALRHSFVDRLPARIDALFDAVRIACTIRERESTEAARRLAHTLYGTSGSLGLHVVATLAVRIERALEDATPRYDEAMIRASQLAEYKSVA